MRTVAFLSVAALIGITITGTAAVGSGSGSGSGLGSGDGMYMNNLVYILFYIF